ncbi:TPA: pentapeptide repeat-containing protein, partial [Salmonella enterica subsp. enterica serovar Muenchen]
MRSDVAVNREGVRKMNAAELSKVLEQHKVWITSLGQEGSRANLSDADLSGANLSDA